MYESPITRILGELQTKIIEHQENLVLQAVRDCDIRADKDELIKALMYDRRQYEKGYADAKAEILELVEGTIDHFDLEEALDLLYQIKEVVQ